MGMLFKDLAFGARTLAKQPGTAVVSVVVLGLGIGLSTFMFSLVYGIFFRGIGVPDADRVATVWRVDRDRPDSGGQQQSISIHDYVDYVERQRSFSSLSAYDGGTINLSGTEGPERFQGSWVTANVFDMLRVQPILGRGFRPEEDLPGAPPVMILGYDAWQNRYGAAPDVVGRAIRINGEAGTIIGVMGPGFRFPSNTDLWVTRPPDPLATERGQGEFVQVAGRLADGVTWEQAELELSTIAAQLEQEHPELNEGMGISVLTFVQAQNGGPIATLFMSMMVAVICVLLVACANVANILLARAAVRSKEAALRIALGASRFRVMAPFFSESLVLAAVGSVLGVGIAYFTVGLFESATAPALTGRPYFVVFQVDLPILLFVVGLAVLTVLAAGAAPALQISRTDVNSILKDDSRGASSFNLSRLSKVLVIAEVALSFALLVGAGLMVKSIVQVSNQEFAFDPDGYVTGRVVLFAADYPELEDRQRYFDEFLLGVQSLPGVAAAGLSDGLPGAGTGGLRIALPGDVYENDEDYPVAHRAAVTPGYFEVLNLNLIEGQDFTVQDDSDAARVAIVNQPMAERSWPGESPIGRQFREGTADTAAVVTIIGVAPDLQMQGFQPAGTPGADPSGYYVPLAQVDRSSMRVLAAPAAGPPIALVPDIRRVSQGLDPDLPLFNVRPLREDLDRASWFYVVFGSVFIVFGIAALFMASIGLYGVLSFSVSRRVQEMGIRMALGADASNVLRLVFRQGAAQIGLGLLFGVALAWGVSRVVALIMFQVDPQDPAVFGTVLAVIAAVGLLATWVPAQRATGVDPMTALRQE